MAIKKIQLRRDVPENWSLNNPVLSNGEIGIELPSSGSAKIKIGNGEKNWNDLDYFAGISDPLCEITYSELVNLRDSQSLVPGNWYRITDYITTTVQSDTKSAGNQFDLIVLALSENELSHHARAIAHEGNTYFDGNDLGAWQIWYDLDNDTDKYEWADAENGKGVIYRMIDEKRNDCPYDFKNALFFNDKLTTNTTEDKYYYTFSYVVLGVLYDGTVEKRVGYCHHNNMKVHKSSRRHILNGTVLRNASFNNACYSNTFGYNCYSNTFKDNCTNNAFGNSCFGNTFGNGISYREIFQSNTSSTTADEYYDDGSGQLVPVKHPDLSTPT